MFFVVFSGRKRALLTRGFIDKPPFYLELLFYRESVGFKKEE